MLILQQADDFGTCPDDRTIAMGSHHMYGTMGIEGGVESHAGTHAHLLNLTFRVDCRLYGMPSHECHGAVGLCINPALVDGMGQTIGIDGRGRGFEIGVVAVEQLMPETGMMLQGRKSGGMLAEQVEQLLALGMSFGQHVEHLAQRQDSPSVSPAPEESRMRLHGLYPSVAEEVLLGYPHTTGKTAHLAGCLVVVFRVARQLAHIGHRGNAHEHIVEPHRILLRTQARESAVGKPILLVNDIAGVVIDERTQTGSLSHARERGLDHRAAHGTGIVEGMRVDDAADIAVDCLAGGKQFLIIRIDFGQQTVALCHIVAIGRIARHFVGSQDAGIGDAPLVAGQSETALLQLHVGIDVLQGCRLVAIRPFAARLLIYQRGRRLCVDVAQHAVHGLFHVFCRRHAIASLVNRLHQMQRCVVVVHLLCDRRQGASA